MNTFDYIIENSFSANGMNLTKSQITALQVALNQKWGASPTLKEDGLIGVKTKKALLDATGITYPPSQDEYNSILAGKSSPSPAVSTALTEAQLKDLWKKSKDRFGGLNKKSTLSDDANFQKWMARQKRIAGLKDFGKGAFQVGIDWLKQKQAGATNDAGVPEEDAPIPTGKQIWGMPAPLVYVGGAVLAGLAIWGISALVSRGQKVANVQQPSMAQ